jgi:hypothetical protein
LGAFFFLFFGDTRMSMIVDAGSVSMPERRQSWWAKREVRECASAEKENLETHPLLC